MAEEEFSTRQDVGVAFNGALAYLDRINTELREFNQNYKDGNIDAMKSNVDILYMELHPKLKKEEREEMKKLLNDTTTAYEQFFENPRQNADILSKLVTFNLKLREFLEKYKFLMPDTDDPRFAAYH